MADEQSADFGPDGRSRGDGPAQYDPGTAERPPVEEPHSGLPGGASPFSTQAHPDAGAAEAQDRVRRSRRKVLLSVSAAGVALAVVLGVVLWPGGHGGARGPVVETRAQAQAHAVLAAQGLETLPAVDLAAVYVPSEGETQTQAQLTVTADGLATGTLRGPASGKADLAWSGDHMYLKGDPAFWAQQEPFHGHDLTSSGHWVAPTKRSGYYMLDSFGVNAGSLTPKALATVVRQIVTDPVAVVEDAGLQGGRRVNSFTGQKGVVVVTATAPFEVVALGIDPVDAGPVRTAVWHPPAGSPSGQVVAPVDYGDGDDVYQPYLFLGPKPATTDQAATVRAAAAGAAAASVPPASTEQSAASDGPAFKIDINTPDLCETDPCSYSVTVTNQGDQPADAVLHLSVPGNANLVYPLGTLAAKQSKQVSGSHPNAARGTNSTVTVTYDAWVYSSTSYGPDPKVADRLRARKLDPQEIVTPPLRPMVATLLDAFTRGTAEGDSAANEAAKDLLTKADDHGHVPLLNDLVSSGRVQNVNELPSLVKTAYSSNNPGEIRQLENAGQFIRNNPNVKVIIDGSYPVGSVIYKADMFALPVGGGTAGAESIQMKTVKSKRNFAANVESGVKQLTGEGGASGKDGFPDNSPPGFKRVLQLNIEAGFPELFSGFKNDLEYDIFNLRKWSSIRDLLCEKRSGGNDLRVQRLIIVNGSGVSIWDNLPDLCAKPPAPPTFGRPTSS